MDCDQITTHLNAVQKQHSMEYFNYFLLENIKAKLDKGGVVGAVFLDLNKAFNLVNHYVLITKLSKFHFSPIVIKWIKSYLTDRKHRFQSDQNISQAYDNYVGVPQGSVLGPLLLFVCLLMTYLMSGRSYI